MKVCYTCILFSFKFISLPLYLIKTYIICFRDHEAYLGLASSGTLKVLRLESQIIKIVNWNIQRSTFNFIALINEKNT